MLVIFLLVLKVVCALVGSRTPNVAVIRISLLRVVYYSSDLSIIVGYPRAFYGYKWGFQQVLRAFSTYLKQFSNQIF